MVSLFNLTQNPVLAYWRRLCAKYRGWRSRRDEDFYLAIRLIWFKAVMNPLSAFGFTLDFLVVTLRACCVHVCVRALFGPRSRWFRGFAASCAAGSLIMTSPLSLTFDFPFMDEGCKMRNMQTSRWKAAYASWDLIGNEMPPYVPH